MIRMLICIALNLDLQGDPSTSARAGWIASATSRQSSARSALAVRARTRRRTCSGTGYCSRPPTCAAPTPRRSAGMHVGTWTLRMDDEHPRVHAKAGTFRTVLLDDRGYVALLRHYLAWSG